MKRVFPHKTEKELNKIANRFYRNFADITVEVLKTTSMSGEEIKKRVHLVNPEIGIELHKQGKPLLVIGGHQGNWEWMGLAFGFYMPEHANVIYKPLQDKKADKFIYNLRSKFGARPISKDSAARELLRKKNEHQVIGLVCDQSPPRDHVYWSHLFGIETDFYPGLVQLPYLLQPVTVFGRVTRLRRGYYQITLIKVGEPPYKKGDLGVLGNFIKETERMITDYPEDYLWTHNRWKHTRTENEEIINFSEK